MSKEDAEKIVAAIAAIAAGEATIALNVSYESADKAEHNRKIVERWKYDLIDLLTKLTPSL